MIFFIRLFKDEHGFEISRFLKTAGIISLNLSIVTLIATVIVFIILMWKNIHPYAEMSIFAGVLLSVIIFICAANLLAFSVIGSNTARIRQSTRKSTQKKQKGNAISAD